MKEELDKVIGRNIERLRKRFDMTQEQVAEFIGKDRVQVSYYENGQRPVPMVILHKLADLFRVDVTALTEENENIAVSDAMLAFRADEIEQDDLKNIASFHKIIKNYMRMKELKKGDKSDG